MTRRNGLPGFRQEACGVAMRDIGSRARRCPKALASRRSGPPFGLSEGVEKP